MLAQLLKLLSLFHNTLRTHAAGEDLDEPRLLWRPRYHRGMAVRPCYFIVEEDGTFTRIAKRTFYRILQQHDDEVHPEYKGRRVKYAQIDVIYEGRRPVEVHRGYYGHVLFDQEGRFDTTEFDQAAQIIVREWDIPKVDEPEVVHFDHSAADEIERRFGWQPKTALREQLYEAALHNKLVGGYRH